MNYLKQFVRGYMHQEFDLYDDEGGALNVFVEDFGGAVAAESLVRDIDDLISTTGGDEEKVADQLDAWGIEVAPSREEKDYRGWLSAVRTRAASLLR